MVELRIGANIKRKEKVEKAMKFAKRMKKVQEKAEIVLKRLRRK